MAGRKGRPNFKTKKQHRAAAALYVKADAYHWIRRVLGAFKQNAHVQERILKGHFDRALEGEKKS